MKLNELEQAVLRLLFESEGFGHNNLDFKQIKVLKRDSSGSGFMTWLVPHDLDLSKGPLTFTGGRVGGRINGNIDVGFVAYIKDGFVDIIEGYTYDEEWPQEVTSFELNLMNLSK